MHVYLVRGSSSWGDYGALLAHGMSRHLPRTSDGLIQLERTGPFVPEVSAPGLTDIVVTDRMRRMLEGSALAGFGFRAICKKHIARLEGWETWDPSSRLPQQMPPHAEPEGYILGAPHDPQAADAVGTLWEIVPEQTWGRSLERKVVSKNPRAYETRMKAGEGIPPDWFHAEGSLHTLVAQSARDLLVESGAAKWLAFDEVALKST